MVVFSTIVIGHKLVDIQLTHAISLANGGRRILKLSVTREHRLIFCPKIVLHTTNVIVSMLLLVKAQGP